MHIPDGYLSPATCAVMYAGAAPFWYVALRQLRRRLSTRLVPLISVFSAFSFVVMMFNLPLPGGTTGHAVGVGLATTVLGPWASILAISVALAIQAVFFGDGGITALGANCFNMAIVGSLVAWGVLRLASAGAAPESRRRVFAAALAGYVAINASALCAAVEFGVQPALFHDAAGVPLYAPYRLGIAIPAMMLGHLTIAGLAEAVISGGVVAFLQRGRSSILPGNIPALAAASSSSRVQPRLAAVLSLLLFCTPLGVLAVGSAWGEWSAREFGDPAARQRIAQSSGNQAPPDVLPKGMQHLASVWSAPFPDYAPRFIRSQKLGYMLSGMFGAGIILGGSLLAQSLLRIGRRQERPR